MDKKEDINDSDKVFRKVVLSWYPGHMAKTKREIEEDLKLVDVVIELLDARIPISSRNPEIVKLTKNKKKIILLNKSDLSNEIINKKWLETFSKEAPTLLTDANSGKGIEKITKKVDSLMEDEIRKQKERGRIKKTIRVMIVGIPNVGKSSLINRISKKSKLEVANRPGVTKSKQWIRISNNQELLDTPGVLWPKFESQETALNLAFTGTIKDDILETTEIAYELLKVLYDKYKTNLAERYKITDEEFSQVENSNNKIYYLMQLIAKKRGALVSGGNTDDERISRIILDDFRNCKLGRISLEEP